jgi:hypothetical protein
VALPAAALAADADGRIVLGGVLRGLKVEVPTLGAAAWLRERLERSALDGQAGGDAPGLEKQPTVWNYSEWMVRNKAAE